MVPETHLKGRILNQEVPLTQSKEAETEMSLWSWLEARDLRADLGTRPTTTVPLWVRLRRKVGWTRGQEAWAAHLAKPSASSYPLNPTWAFTPPSLSMGIQGWRRRKSLSTTNQVPAAHMEGLLGASP